MAKKYASLNTLSTFLDNLKNLFATKSEVNNEVSTINNSIATSIEEVKKYSADGNTNALEMAVYYTDNAVAQKTQVQIITWGADD